MRSGFLHLFLVLLLFGAPSCGSEGGESSEESKPGKKKKKGKKKGKKSSAKKKKRIPPDVLKALGSEDLEKRSEAMKKAVKFGADGVEPLSALLDEGDVQTRTAALECLGRIGDRSAKESVERSLKKAATWDDLLYGLKALGFVGDDSSIPVLKKYLAFVAKPRFPAEAKWMIEKGRETEEGMIRSQAAESLVRLGDTSGVPVLIENLLSNGWVRKDALIRLRRMTGCMVDHGYNLGDGKPVRAQAVDRWKAWWAENKDTFEPEWTDSVKVFDLNKRK
ncbi:MAG: HEAT repeat domain-containing protein [Planctomycetota bacterium]|jgi:HEAT repeat protein